MPFDNKNEDGTQTTGNQEQEAADKAAELAAQQSQQGDHQSVFLVAGERAFRDADAVVKNIESSQSHITTLEAEGKVGRDRITELEKENARLQKIEDSLDGRNQTGNADTTSQLSNDELAIQAANAAVGMIEQKASEEVRSANLAGAEAKAELAYGKEGCQAKIEEIATTLGMNLAAVDELGKTSPDAFARLFLPAAPGMPHTPTRTTVNMPAGDGQQQETKPANVTRMRERERISHVTGKMEAAGIVYGNQQR